MTLELTPFTPAAMLAQSPFARLANLVLDTVSQRSRRDYGRARRDFVQWHLAAGQPVLHKGTVQAHIAHLQATGVIDSSINQRLAAIRKLALAAADNELISESAAQAIAGWRISSARTRSWAPG